MHPDWQAFLAAQGATLIDGGVADFGADQTGVATQGGATMLCDLSHLGLLLASGDDATAFLHGQLTNEVQALSEGDLQLNGYCSVKGRLLATFLLWPARQGYLMQLPQELIEPVRKRLSMFVLRSKVKLEDVSEQWIRIGVSGPQAEALLQAHFGAIPPRQMSTSHAEGARVLRLSTTRFEIVATVDAARAAWTAFAGQCTKVGRDAWTRLDIHVGWPTVMPVTQDLFVPQMVNYELIGGVSFRKGCYPGQEIVARTQYRGILKRRMILAHLAEGTAAQPGDSVYSSVFDEQVAGQIVNLAAAPDGGFDMLVVAQVEAIRSGDLHLGSSSGPALSLKPLPYSIPQADSEESHPA